VQSTPHSDLKSRLQDYFFLGLLFSILLLLAYVLLPFFGGLLGAVILGIAFYPLHKRLARWMPPRSPTAQALITDGLVILFFIVPLILLVWVLVKEAEGIAPTLKEWRTAFDSLRQGEPVDALRPVQTLRDWLRTTLGIRPAQFRREVAEVAEYVIQFLSLSGAAFAKNSLEFMVNLVIMALTLFFVFRDGVKMSITFQSYIPLPADVKVQLAERINGTVVGILRGMFLTSLVQGLVASVGYLIIGVPAVALLGFLTALAGLIPSVGTSIVWLPLAGVYFLQDSFSKGIFLLAWGGIIVGLVDNFLRPYFMKGNADLPFLAMFFAILGGVQVWGFKGLVLGPLLMAIAPVLLHAYRRRYLNHP
jgi:predicted PurR-regulated permease PerM